MATIWVSNIFLVERCSHATRVFATGSTIFSWICEPLLRALRLFHASWPTRRLGTMLSYCVQLIFLNTFLIYYTFHSSVVISQGNSSADVCRRRVSFEDKTVLGTCDNVWSGTFNIFLNNQLNGLEKFSCLTCLGRSFSWIDSAALDNDSKRWTGLLLFYLRCTVYRFF